MKTFFRFSGRLAAGLLVLLLAVAGGGTWWLKSTLSREALIRQLESSLSAEVNLDDARLSVWSFPAHLRLENLVVRAKGTQTTDTTPVVKLREGVMDVSLFGLLAGRLDVGTLLLDGLEVQEYVSPEGESRLAVLMKKPRLEPGEPQLPRDPKPKVPKDDKEKKVTPVFQADQLGMTVRVQEARIVDGQLHIHKRVTKTRTKLTDLQLTIREIDVDPSQLKRHNRADIELSVKLTMDGRGKVAGEMTDVSFADVHASGKGSLQPFDEETGAWSPISTFELVIAKSSVMAGYMTIGQASPSAVTKMMEYGIDLADMPVGGALSQDARVRMVFHQNRLTLLDEARFPMPEYEARMNAGSWVNASEDQHEFDLRLVCGEELEDRVKKGIVANGLPQAVADGVAKAFRDEDAGRMAFDLRATGRLTRPDIKPAWSKTLEQLIRGSGVEDVLRSFLK